MNLEIGRGAKFGFTQRHKEKSRHNDLPMENGA